MSPIRQQKVDNMSNIKENNVEILVQILNQTFKYQKNRFVTLLAEQQKTYNLKILGHNNPFH